MRSSALQCVEKPRCSCSQLMGRDWNPQPSGCKGLPDEHVQIPFHIDSLIEGVSWWTAPRTYEPTAATVAEEQRERRPGIPHLSSAHSGETPRETPR
ncbi:hypothetical protein GN956_G23821 [Arapaima gigas]